MLRTFGYFWAAPNTLAALLLFGGLALISRGRCRVRRGAIEISGGAIAWFLRRGTVLPGGAAAMTLGHVILGTDAATLDRVRDHEHVHVGQYMRWGPLFIPAYLLASLYAALRGGHFYRDNAFERAAFAQAPFGEVE